MSVFVWCKCRVCNCNFRRLKHFNIFAVFCIMGLKRNLHCLLELSCSMSLSCAFFNINLWSFVVYQNINIVKKIYRVNTFLFADISFLLLFLSLVKQKGGRVKGNPFRCMRVWFCLHTILRNFTVMIYISVVDTLEYS